MIFQNVGCWSYHISGTVKATTNIFPYSREEFFKRIQWDQTYNKLGALRSL
jgi:hypothetical protein